MPSTSGPISQADVPEHVHGAVKGPVSAGSPLPPSQLQHLRVRWFSLPGCPEGGTEAKAMGLRLAPLARVCPPPGFAKCSLRVDRRRCSPSHPSALECLAGVRLRGRFPGGFSQWSWNQRDSQEPPPGARRGLSPIATLGFQTVAEDMALGRWEIRGSWGGRALSSGT